MKQKTQVIPKEIQCNDLMAFIYYGKVVNKVSKLDGKVELDVKSIDGIDGGGVFSVRGNDLIERAYSADQYSREEHVTKTNIAEILISVYNRPFTVCFIKANGLERVLRGRLIKPEKLMGRSSVEDLDIVGENTLRLVDHRNIVYLIVNGVKYITK